MGTTGYSDTFNRTVSNGLGTATSGQVYTLSSTATQYNVAASTATILPSVGGDLTGTVDNQTQDADISGRVALSAIPATNSAQVGLVAKWASSNNYYFANMLVLAGGAISVRLSSRISGVGGTVKTVATGLTYVANTFYNMRFQVYWSAPLQTNILSAKLWLTGTTEPTGWTVTGTDAGLDPYFSGTQVGIMGRDDSTVLGSVTAKLQAVATRTYSLPVPVSTDPMCYDPAFPYPKQTALESLADATDAALVTLDPFAALAGLFPRVRVSNTNLPIPTASISVNVGYIATEFNVGTPTNLGYDNQSLYLGVGIWMITYELQLKEAASDYILANFVVSNANAGDVFAEMRSNPSVSNDQGVGGTLHMSRMATNSDPTTSLKVSVVLSPNNIATTYTGTYTALSAIKISDYFA